MRSTVAFDDNSRYSFNSVFGNGPQSGYGHHEKSICILDRTYMCISDLLVVNLLVEKLQYFSLPDYHQLKKY